jgi:hypothetical protein
MFSQTITQWFVGKGNSMPFHEFSETTMISVPHIKKGKNIGERRIRRMNERLERKETAITLEEFAAAFCK